MRLFRFQHPRGGHLLPHERHREAEPRGPGRPQDQHAPLPERGDDHRHPEVSAIKRETLICSVKCKFAVFLCFYIYLVFYSLILLVCLSY